MLPETTQRIVVLDAGSAAGFYAVEALVTSALVPASVAIVAAVAPAPQGLAAAAVPTARANLDAMAADPAVGAGRLTVVDSTERRGPGVRLDPGKDVVVYATQLFEPSVIQSAIAGMAGVPLPPLVVITSDGAHQNAAATMASDLAKSRVVHVRIPFAAPPTTTQLVHGHVPDLISPVESFCLGVALGVTRFFPVNASQPADIVPMDVALTTAFAAYNLCAAGRFPPSAKNANHVLLSLVADAERSLCWGMVGEYVLDYYGRFGAAIATCLPGTVFSKDPTLAFNAHFPDLWNYGLSLTTPIEMYRQRHAMQTKTYLRQHQHSASAERMKGALNALEASLENAVRQTATKRAATYDNASYGALLRRLSQNRSDVPVFRAASIDVVQWERYVKLIAVRVLHYLARNLMNHREPLRLPQAVPVWTNDFEFQGVERAPEPNLPLRRVVDDVHFFLRSGQQPNGQPIVLTPGGSPRTFMGILAQPHVQALITRLADEQALSREDVEARANKILRQIGDNVNHTQARTLAYVLRKVFKQVYTRVSLNPEAYDILHKVFTTPRTAVVLMPSHRSYMDFIILSYTMLTMGFPLPHICAGEDFLRLGAVADYLRGSGAFFMRRTFKGDALYAALFKEYVRHLVRKGEAIEFFVEGTRSRTQKTLAPKLGFLKIITDAFLERQTEVTDVLFVPISLSYEKVLEGNLYADELLGLPKPKETPANLLRSATVLQQKFGSFNVNVAQPISLADFVKDPHQVPDGHMRKGKAPAAATSAAGPQAGLVARAAAAVGLGPSEVAKAAPPAAANAKTDAALDSGGPTPPLVLQRLAWRVTYELERHLVVTPTSLAAAVVLHMFDHTTLRDDGVPFAEVASAVEWLRSKVLAAGGLMNHRYAAFDGPSLLAYAVKLLSPHVTVSPLNKIFMSKASIATYMALSMYTNQLVHLFADESAIAVAANALAPAGLEAAPSFAPAATSAAADEPPMSSNMSTGGEGVDAAQSAAAAAFTVSAASLQRVSGDVQRLMAHELPHFQPPSPLEPNHNFARTLCRMAGQRCVEGYRCVTPAPSAKGGASAITVPLPEVPPTVQLVPNQYFSFAAQLLYPCIESYFVVHVALAATLRGAPDARVPEAVLLGMAHKLALRLYDAKLAQYVACSNKETLKNALTIAYEAKTVVVFKGGRASMTALPKGSGGGQGAAALMERLRDINSLRSRPAGAEDLARAVDSAIELYAGMTKLQGTAAASKL